MAKRLFYQDLTLPPVQTTEISDFTSIDWLVSGVAFPPPPPRRHIPFLVDSYLLIEFQPVVPIPLPYDFLPNIGNDWVPPPRFNPADFPFGRVEIQQSDIPALPLNGWFETDYSLPVRRGRLRVRQHPFGDVAIPESLFTVPPAAPDYFGAPDLWQETDGLDRPYRATQEPFHDVAWIPEGLFGIPDYHPGYWYSDLDSRTKRRRRIFDQWNYVIPSSLYADSVPLIFPHMGMAELPPKKNRPIHSAILMDNAALFRFIGQDGLRFLLSGANADGGAQSDPDSSLGGYRSATEVKRAGWIVFDGIDGITVEMASGINGDSGDMGSLIALDADTLSYTAPFSETPGEPVYVLPGGSAAISDGEDPSKFVRVSRSDTGDMAASLSLEFDEVFGNPIGMDVIDYTGGNRYRAVVFRNISDSTIYDLKIWIEEDPVAVPLSSIVTPLVADSTGVLYGPTDAFISWPTSGWARIEKSDGTLREIAYYFSRVNDQLGFLGAGRGALGTTAQPCLSSDVVKCVPGLRIAWEWASPKANGAVQTISDESTAPTGVSWSTGITSSTGLSISKIQSNENGALWIHRETPSQSTAIARVSNRIMVQWTVEGVTYQERLSGLYRIRNTNLARYEAYVGAGAPPDLDASPTTTSSSKPFTISTVMAANTDYYVAVAYRNEFNLISQDRQWNVFRRDGATGLKSNPPSAPQQITWTASAGGAFVLEAVYFTAGNYDLNGSNSADQWLIYYRYDGADPNPNTDVPVVVPMAISGNAAYIKQTSDPWPDGTVGKVLVRVRRSGSPNSDSQNITIYSATASTSGDGTPIGSIHWRKSAEEAQ